MTRTDSRSCRQHGPRPWTDRAERAVLGDRGAATVLLVVLAPALFALGGLLIDGGTELSARQRSADLAEQAARAGADQLDTASLRATGVGQLDPSAARDAACRYVRSVEPGAICTAAVLATPSGQQVQVRVRTSTPTILLGVIGVNTLHTDGVATAQAVTGVRTAALGPGTAPRGPVGPPAAAPRSPAASVLLPPSRLPSAQERI